MVWDTPLGFPAHTPVSYTHLDVYKRQVHTVIDGDKANATLTQNFHNLTYFQIVTTHAAPVSYTHLDVYKRQCHKPLSTQSLSRLPEKMQGTVRAAQGSFSHG